MPDFNTMQRQRLAARNQALPDGSFPIRNVADLKRAIQAYGRAKDKARAKAWIIKRARALGATDLLPEGWISDTLVHYGIKGQKWGVRRYQNEDGSLTSKGRSRYTSFKTKGYAKKAQRLQNKAAEARKSKNQYTKDKASVYEYKAKQYSQRAKRSQEFDERYKAEYDKREAGKRFVTAALIGSMNYDAYIKQRAAGISKGKAMVNTFLGGSLAAAKVRSDYINQDVKKDRADNRAMERADKQFNKAASAYQNAKSSRNKAEKARYEKSGDHYRQKGLSELNKQNLTYNDIYGKRKVTNSDMAKSNFDYKKDKYNYYRRW